MHREFQTGLSSGRHRLEPESAHLVIERQGRLEFFNDHAWALGRLNFIAPI
jgi:hypothetical protein